MIKLIVAGGRDYNNYERAKEEIADFIYLQEQDGNIEILSGACDTGTHTFTRKDGTKVYGADGLGERYAEEMGWPVSYFPADWKQFGKMAGPARNIKMSVVGTHCLTFWDTKSRGTLSMIKAANKMKLVLKIVNY